MPGTATERRLLHDGALLRERVLLLGSPRSCFVAVASPEGPASVGAVICSPLWAEQMKNYRREVLLGRALAARGFVCARFHYRGVGHSRGDPQAIDISSMTDDAVA